ncbi:ABC transporter ATP-binding protein [Gordonia sp. ABSL1-1]|uniref:ATP-binding cassette domain-containing protein n=1 Tax=Gordonia sp. ABSL1-1 TaxID=3053923 RepID=UPI0025747009|nr:ABC transporter ATP-binding protein [Gordonia sp. ABSL1-1]MDL9937288.1 ABC transporter ATP-binding protein [Gordonia sp. ABSL1-1]
MTLLSERPRVRTGLVEVDGLRVTARNGRDLVSDVSLSIAPGRAVGLVGESGSGKTLTAMAIAGLLPTGVRVSGGRIDFDGLDVTARDDLTARTLLRDRIGVVFQNPTVALNPRLPIGAQLREALPAEIRRSRSASARRSRELLDYVGIERADERLAAYPHELSGGLNQRVVIATAIARSPSLLIADEATTALDATVQRQVLDLIDRLRDDLGLAVLLVSHDIGVIADRTEDIVVMAEGRVRERGRTDEVLAAPRVDYTRELLAAMPDIDAEPPLPPPLDAPAVLVGRGLTRNFVRPGRGRARISAVDGVDLDVRQGQSLGIVGESGSGKTTLARILVGLDRPDAGSLHAAGVPVTGRSVTARRRSLSGVQFVFQDPYLALDPLQTVADSIGEPIDLGGTPQQRRERRDIIDGLLDDVRLPRDYAHRRPGELSGGQRQRVVIARALATGPRVLVADEPVAALDLHVQDSILKLLARLREERQLTYVVISHDLAVIRQLCTDVAVMRAGQIVERGTTTQIFDFPTHSVTRSLLAAIPGGNPRKRAVL